jgi:hypothetical protein
MLITCLKINTIYSCSLLVDRSWVKIEKQKREEASKVKNTKRKGG